MKQNKSIEHELKTWTEYFRAVKSGEKNFELRRNDRDFQVGDMLMLCEYCPETRSYSGESLRRKITYVLKGGQFGLEPDMCILGMAPPWQSATIEPPEVGARVYARYQDGLDVGEAVATYYGDEEWEWDDLTMGDLYEPLEWTALPIYGKG